MDVSTQATRLNAAIERLEHVLEDADLRFVARVTLDDEYDLLWHPHGGSRRWRVCVAATGGGKLATDRSPLTNSTLAKRIAAATKLPTLYEAVLRARDEFMADLPAALAAVEEFTETVEGKHLKERR